MNYGIFIRIVYKNKIFLYIIIIEEIDWDNRVWDIIHSYFKHTKNYLSKHQIDSYNTFLNTNISKTIRQFNPIVLPYYQYKDSNDKGTGEYRYELIITIGGSV